MSGDDVFPDRDMSHRDKVEFMLERQGWAIDAVAADTDPEAPIPRYAYTIGFEDRFGFPELCCFGLTPVACHGLFTLMAEARSEEHTSELPSLMRISYAVSCLQKQKRKTLNNYSR